MRCSTQLSLPVPGSRRPLNRPELLGEWLNLGRWTENLSQSSGDDNGWYIHHPPFSAMKLGIMYYGFYPWFYDIVWMVATSRATQFFHPRNRWTTLFGIPTVLDWIHRDHVTKWFIIIVPHHLSHVYHSCSKSRRGQLQCLDLLFIQLLNWLNISKSPIFKQTNNILLPIWGVYHTSQSSPIISSLFPSHLSPGPLTSPTLLVKSHSNNAIWIRIPSALSFPHH